MVEREGVAKGWSRGLELMDVEVEKVQGDVCEQRQREDGVQTEMGRIYT